MIIHYNMSKNQPVKLHEEICKLAVQQNGNALNYVKPKL
jgi:hypothetical protein